MKTKNITLILVILTVCCLAVFGDFNDFGQVVIDRLNITNEIVMNYSGNPVNISGIDCTLFHDGGISCSSP